VKLRLDAGLVLIVAGRFLISPLLLALVVRGMDLPLLMKKVFLIQASMPAMTQTPILAKAYGADAEYASVTTSFATVLSLAAIPLYMGIIDRIFP
jgi:predicted permease